MAQHVRVEREGEFGRGVDFEALKAQADFRTVLAHYGFAAGRGDQFTIRCPFHDDRTPSCSINVSKGLFHCFGCPASGNVLDFVHRMEARGGEVEGIASAVTQTTRRRNNW